MNFSGIGGKSVRGFSADVVDGPVAGRPEQQGTWLDEAELGARLPSGWWLLPATSLGAVIWLAIGWIVWQWL